MSIRFDEKWEIDWNNNGRYDHPASDITPSIVDYSYEHGASIFGDSRSVGISLAKGEITLDAFPFSETAIERFQTRTIRQRVSGQTVFEATILPFVYNRDPDRWVGDIISKNTDKMSRRVNIGYTSAPTVQEFWEAILTAADLIPGQSSFVNYALPDFIRARGVVRLVLNDFANLFGGYILEDAVGNISFIAPRSRTERASIVIEPDTHYFTSVLDLKVDYVRNTARIPFNFVTTTPNREIFSREYTLVGGFSQNVIVNAPNNSLVENWALTSSDPNLQAVIDTSATNLFMASFSLSNETSQAVTATVTLTGDVTEITSVTEAEFSTPASINRFGEKEFPRLQPWVRGNEPVIDELHRLQSPLDIHRIQIPLDTDVEGLLLHDIGTSVIINIDEPINYLLGRRFTEWQEHGIMIWDLIELPLAYDIEYFRWGFSRWNINTYLAPGDYVDPGAPARRVLTWRGKRITWQDKPETWRAN